LFFVLSGFLVSGLLFREFETTGGIRPTRFLIRRGWKIYPAFWVLIAASIALSIVRFGDVGVRSTLAELTFCQNYAIGWWGHTWSIAVEEHFYLILPFLLAALAKDRFAALPRIVVATMIALLAARCLNAVRPFADRTHLFPTHLRLDGLFFGVLLCYWYRTWPEFKAFGERYSRWLVVAGVLLMAPAFIFDVKTSPWLYTGWLTMQSLGSGALLIGLVCGGIRENWLTRGTAGVGFYSYSIYLWHMPVIFVMAPVFGFSRSLPLIFAVSVVVGISMAKIVEGPCLRMREVFNPQPSLPTM
jgi:peptidoglycan/LPS O-acetylase OafA/YrhL